METSVQFASEPRKVAKMLPSVPISNDPHLGLEVSPLDRYIVDIDGEQRFGAISESQALSYHIRPYNKIDSRAVYFQVAVLYTTSHGKRHLRVLNLSIAVSSFATNIFRFADVETAFTIWMKELVNGRSGNPALVQESLTKRCIDLLHSYRVLCCDTVASSQVRLVKRRGWSSTERTLSLSFHQMRSSYYRFSAYLLSNVNF